MKVKICGLKHYQDALIAEKAGVDFIGFVFAPSSRRISPLNAGKISKKLSSQTQKVGVFVDESVENIKHIAQVAGLDYVQLHGNEPASVAEAIPLPIIKAFTFGQTKIETMLDYPCDYLLVDSPGEKFAGGSGKSFNWRALDQDKVLQNKLILAGGLTPENVANAIQTTKALGVDVSSGVESNKEKDQDKIIQFIQNAKKTGKVEI